MIALFLLPFCVSAAKSFKSPTLNLKVATTQALTSGSDKTVTENPTEVTEVTESTEAFDPEFEADSSSTESSVKVTKDEISRSFILHVKVSDANLGIIIEKSTYLFSKSFLCVSIK